MVFSLTQIGLCAIVGAVATAIVLAVYGKRRGEDDAVARAVAVGLVAGVSILLWRSAANVGVLNDDPIPWVSPNDVLAPVVAYVGSAAYAGLRSARDRAPSAAPQAIVAIVTFVVNVLVI